MKTVINYCSGGGYGSSPGQFSGPTFMASDSNNNIYVLDVGNYRIQKFNSEGVFIMQWGTYGPDISQFRRLSGISIDVDDFVYISDSISGKMLKSNSDGVFIESISTVGELLQYKSVAVDSDSNIFTGSNQIIFHVDEYGKLLNQWNLSGVAETKGIDIAIDNVSNVYVCKEGIGVIQKYTADGQLITEWGTQGSAPGEFNSPNAITVDPNGKIYVADTENHRIQVFVPNG